MPPNVRGPGTLVGMGGYVLGARYVCTSCHTRGTSPTCRCERRGETIDVATERLDDASRALFVRRNEPVQRRDVARHLLRSKLEWIASVLLSLITLTQLELGSTPRAETIVVGFVFFLSVLVGMRLVVFVVALLSRLVLAIGLVALGGASLLVSRLVRRRDVLARRAFDGALSVLSFVARKKRFAIRWPSPTAGAEAIVASLGTVPSPRVANGVLGAIAVEDAELEPFEVVLPSGEQVRIAGGVGVLRVDEDAIARSEPHARGAGIFAEAERLDLDARVVTLRGGTWRTVPAASGHGSAFREPPTMRELVGTEDEPLEIAIHARPR